MYIINKTSENRQCNFSLLGEKKCNIYTHTFSRSTNNNKKQQRAEEKDCCVATLFGGRVDPFYKPNFYGFSHGSTHAIRTNKTKKNKKNKTHTNSFISEEERKTIISFTCEREERRREKKEKNQCVLFPLKY
jgi:hypothetical protein